MSPYLVLVEEIEPWGGACVPKRTFPSNNGIRGDSVRGERENPRNLGHTLKGTGRDAMRPHWAVEYHRQGGCLSVQYIGVDRRALGRIEDWLFGVYGLECKGLVR